MADQPDAQPQPDQPPQPGALPNIPGFSIEDYLRLRNQLMAPQPLQAREARSPAAEPGDRRRQGPAV